jgi:hypothetical protein
MKRPRRSNQSLSIRRAIKAQEVIAGVQSIRRKSRLNWTEARLRKLLPGVFSTEREEHFARALRALKAQPRMTTEQIADAASRINPQPLMDGKWLWPVSTVTLMREYADRAPPDGVDPGKLRAVLAGIGTEDARGNFMRMLLEVLERRPVTNLKDIRFLRQLRERHDVFTTFLQGASEPYAQPLEIQNPHGGHWWNDSIAVRGPAPISPIRVLGEIVPQIPRRRETRELMKDLEAPSIVVDYPDWSAEKRKKMPTDVRRHRFIPPKQRPVKRA